MHSSALTITYGIAGTDAIIEIKRSDVDVLAFPVSTCTCTYVLRVNVLLTTTFFVVLQVGLQATVST